MWCPSPPDPILLDASGHAGLVVMGGPMSACHLARTTWHAARAARTRPTFRVGAFAWGPQFHLEVTPAAVDGFLAPALPRPRPSPPWRDLVFDRFAALVAAGTGAAAPDGSRHRFANISES